jgi:hypothetical protein
LGKDVEDVSTFHNEEQEKLEVIIENKKFKN